MKFDRINTLLVVAGVFASAVSVPGFAASATNTITIDTQEITRPDVAVGPDGDWLVFTAPGHMFRLPASGGSAEQLTFGPWFEPRDPTTRRGRVSPPAPAAPG